jgi:hypothetical protein
MNTNISSNTTITTATTPSKRSSLSSRASKIPQKLAQSSFFSLRPSASTLISNENEGQPRIPSSPIPYSDNNNRLTARIGQMLFRQRTTSESVIKESRSFSTQSCDYSSSSLGRNNSQSRSLGIIKNNDNNDAVSSRSEKKKLAQ